MRSPEQWQSKTARAAVPVWAQIVNSDTVPWWETEEEKKERQMGDLSVTQRWPFPLITHYSSTTRRTHSRTGDVSKGQHQSSMVRTCARYAARVTDTLSCSHTWGRVRGFLVSLSFLILWKPFPYGLSATVTLCVTRGRRDFGERAFRLRVERWHSKIQAKLSVFPCRETDTRLRDAYEWTLYHESVSQKNVKEWKETGCRKEKREREREEESMSVSGPWCVCLLCSSLITCQINSSPSAAHHVCVCARKTGRTTGLQEAELYTLWHFQRSDFSLHLRMRARCPYWNRPGGQTGWNISAHAGNESANNEKIIYIQDIFMWNYFRSNNCAEMDGRLWALLLFVNMIHLSRWDQVNASPFTPGRNCLIDR